MDLRRPNSEPVVTYHATSSALKSAVSASTSPSPSIGTRVAPMTSTSPSPSTSIANAHLDPAFDDAIVCSVKPPDPSFSNHLTVSPE